MSRCSRWPVDVICLVIFFMAVAVRLVKLVFEPLLLRDGALYLRLAEIWYKTGEYGEYLEISNNTIRFPPLPLLCIKTLMGVTGDPEIAGRSISVFLGGLIPVIGFILARKITHNIRLSLVAALFFILHPNLVSYSTQPLRENYFIFLIGLLLIVMVRNFRTPKVTDWIICGAILGITSFCRTEALEYLVIVALEIAILKLRKDRILSFFQTIGVFLLSFVLASFSLLTWTGGDYYVKRVEIYSNRFFSEIMHIAHFQ